MANNKTETQSYFAPELLEDEDSILGGTVTNDNVTTKGGGAGQNIANYYKDYTQPGNYNDGNNNNYGTTNYGSTPTYSSNPPTSSGGMSVGSMGEDWYKGILPYPTVLIPRDDDHNPQGNVQKSLYLKNLEKEQEKSKNNTGGTGGSGGGCNCDKEEKEKTGKEIGEQAAEAGNTAASGGSSSGGGAETGAAAGASGSSTANGGCDCSSGGSGMGNIDGVTGGNNETLERNTGELFPQIGKFLHDRRKSKDSGLMTSINKFDGLNSSLEGLLEAYRDGSLSDEIAKLVREPYKYIIHYKKIGTEDKITKFEELYSLTKLPTRSIYGQPVINPKLVQFILEDEFGNEINRTADIELKNYGSTLYVGAFNPRNKKKEETYEYPAINSLDLAGKIHDLAYNQLLAAGATDALLNLKTIEADKKLVLDAFNVIKLYLTHTIDPVNAQYISKETYEAAIFVAKLFLGIVAEKEARLLPKKAKQSVIDRVVIPITNYNNNIWKRWLR